MRFLSTFALLCAAAVTHASWDISEYHQNNCKGEAQAAAGNDVAQGCTSMVDDIRGGVHSVRAPGNGWRITVYENGDCSGQHTSGTNKVCLTADQTYGSIDPADTLWRAYKITKA
ncbi:uncharacterized protein CDV56_105836 [Aspergillus thermomutatus]|uniref:Uncharacterized protein n=1 Tax=Aspergillus thermomutatus TaxID=41047 RepID=A0A397GH95_ASPTH|nr:uncharacterized protein CDV56_105836 [Aspergillus thermomutatus]RHZ48796.1 hypothetical protein CDV56_105836 [Aspergillus thermomutatus]